MEGHDRSRGFCRISHSRLNIAHPLGLPLFGHRAKDRPRNIGRVDVHHVADKGRARGVALAEDNVKALQEWAKPGTAEIGILPKAAFERFAGRLPGVSPPQ